jgi:hypothetical protein
MTIGAAGPFSRIGQEPAEDAATVAGEEHPLGACAHIRVTVGKDSTTPLGATRGGLETRTPLAGRSLNLYGSLHLEPERRSLADCAAIRGRLRPLRCPGVRDGSSPLSRTPECDTSKPAVAARQEARSMGLTGQPALGRSNSVSEWRRPKPDANSPLPDLGEGRAPTSPIRNQEKRGGV